MIHLADTTLSLEQLVITLIIWPDNDVRHHWTASWLETEIPCRPVQCPDKLSLQECLLTVKSSREGSAGDEAVAETLQTVEDDHTGHAELQPPHSVLRGGAERAAVFLTQQLGLVGRKTLNSGVEADERFPHQDIGHDSSGYWAAPRRRQDIYSQNWTEDPTCPVLNLHRERSGSAQGGLIDL